MTAVRWIYVLAGLAIFSLIVSVCVVGAIALGRWWTDRRDRQMRMSADWLRRHRPPIGHPDGGRRAD